MQYFFQLTTAYFGTLHQACRSIYLFCHAVSNRPLYGWIVPDFPRRRVDGCLQHDKKTVRWKALLLLAFCLPSFAFSQKTTAVTGVSITVEDLDREVDFFVKNLDFQKIKEEKWSGEEVATLFGLSEKTAGVRIVTLQLGDEKIRLMDFDGAESRPVATDMRSNDLWFQHLAIVVSNMDAAYRKLLKNKVVHVSTAPQTLPGYLPNAAGIKAFYFRDPEGHNLELIWFPPEKGGRWKVEGRGSETSGAGQPSTLPPLPSTLFLGIDHTAIGISDTDTSMAFYRDALGLVHGGHSENYGTEQEHLNQVFGARLDINGLHADTGFGVEFLRYIAPPGGRPYPADSSPTDLWHYQTELEVDDLPKMLQQLEKQGFTKISSAVAKIGNVDMFLVRDPDGHAVLLKSKET